MTVTINGTTGVTAATFDGAVDSADLTGNVDAARITGALNASGSAPIYACRAWVNFNGTGTVAIRGSGNVSSITDLGVGNYQINFATAMPDANYAVLASGKNQSNGVNVTFLALLQSPDPTTTACYVRQLASGGGGGGDTDNNLVCVAVFR